MRQLLIFLLLLVLPFLVLPFGSSYFETPKVIVAEILIQLLLIVVLMRARKTNQHLKLVILGLALLSLVSFVIFGFSENIFWGNSYRLQGMFLFWHLLALLFISSVSHFRVPPQLFCFVILLLALETLLMGQNLDRRFIGSLGEPNSLAATALFFLSFCIGKSKRPLKLALIVVTAFIVFLSGSKSGLLALCLIVTATFLVQHLKLSLVKTAIICLVALTLSLGLPVLEGGGWFENRWEIWQTAAAAGLDSPLIGHGFGNIEHTLKETSLKLNNRVYLQIIDSSHNLLLDFWVQGGLIGLSLFGYLLWLFLHKIKELSLLNGFLAIFTIALFNPVSVVNLVALWWILGQGVRHIDD